MLGYVMIRSVHAQCTKRLDDMNNHIIRSLLQSSYSWKKLTQSHLLPSSYVKFSLP